MGSFSGLNSPTKVSVMGPMSVSKAASMKRYAVAYSINDKHSDCVSSIKIVKDASRDCWKVWTGSYDKSICCFGLSPTYKHSATPANSPPGRPFPAQRMVSAPVLPGIGNVANSPSGNKMFQKPLPPSKVLLNKSPSVDPNSPSLAPQLPPPRPGQLQKSPSITTASETPAPSNPPPTQAPPVVPVAQVAQATAQVATNQPAVSPREPSVTSPPAVTEQNGESGSYEAPKRAPTTPKPVARTHENNADEVCHLQEILSQTLALLEDEKLKNSDLLAEIERLRSGARPKSGSLNSDWKTTAPRADFLSSKQRSLIATPTQNP
eukprot:TRINITY_DN4832_c0_g2_i3.p1 TRINITY_DN4832_c0_g2~~TRINITY_DN4832_c0_g2_i3.p1  ORF type:complete len:321 (+),score=96.75 TRINITY_DN4832_c0_g2_i3:150-1112(+)